MRATGPKPRVSIVMACRNASRTLETALYSARAQTLGDIEIILTDDASTDDSAAIGARHALEDNRICLLTGRGSGPGAARNLALGVARGDWVAVLDSDDMMHPRRLEYMLQAADPDVDILVDNCLEFDDPLGRRKPRLLLAEPSWANGQDISLAKYIVCNSLFSDEPPLGYLKPLIRREALVSRGLHYDEALRIGEDCDLLMRLAASGAGFRFVPAPLYFYRKHQSSTSFRMNSPDIEALLAASTNFVSTIPQMSGKVRGACQRRDGSLLRALHFTRAVEQVKKGDFFACLKTLLLHPRSVLLMLQALYATLLRRTRKASPTETNDAQQTMTLIRRSCVSEGGPDPLIETIMVLDVDEGNQIGSARWVASALRVAEVAPVARIICEDPILMEFAAFAQLDLYFQRSIIEPKQNEQPDAIACEAL